MSTDGGSAFPSDYLLPENYGISKLEFFAAAIATGLAANHAGLEGIISVGNSQEVGGAKALAVMCFTFAEAMLAESERRSK